jgi:hypothetical protein
MERDGLIRHTVPAPWPLRVFLIACGAFVLVMPLWEFHRTLWPISFFGLIPWVIVLGAISISIPLLVGGLLGPAADWTIGPGRIDIVLINLFSRRQHHFTPADVQGFSLRETESDDGPSNWQIVMRSTAGKSYWTQSRQSQQAAQQLLDDIRRVFYAEPGADPSPAAAFPL